MYYQNHNPIIKTYQQCYEDPLFFSCTWSISKQCNYKCSYCDTWKEQQYKDKEYLKKIINFCNYLSDKYNLRLTLYGGEPLVHPELFYIIENLKQSIYPLHYFTNLSIEEEKLKELIFKRKFVKFLTSFHYQKADFNNFVKKVELILKNNIPVTTKVMWNPLYKKEILQVYNEFKRLEKHELFNCSLDLIINKDCKFTDEDLNFYKKEHNNDKIKDHVVEYVDEEGNVSTKSLTFNHIRLLDVKTDFLGQCNFYGYECEAGNRHIVINENGDIFRCTYEEWENNKLCNLLEQDINYDKVVRDKKICYSYNCRAEVSVPKERTSESCTKPYIVCMIVTQKCNWVCEYCDRPLLKEMKDINEDVFRKYFPRIIKKYSEVPLYINGGELGLLNHELLEYIFSFDKKLRICTNGLFITKGYFKEFYDKIEQVILHVRIERGMEINIDDPKLLYLFVVNHQNIGKIKRFIERNNEPKKQWMLQNYQPKNPLDENDKFQLTKGDYAIMLRDLLSYSNYKFEYQRIVKRVQDFNNDEKLQQYRKICRDNYFFPMFDFTESKILFCKQSALFTNYVELNEQNFYKLEKNVLHFNTKPDIVCDKCYEATDYFLDLKGKDK
jgi:organic radical activating enzyme